MRVRAARVVTAVLLALSATLVATPSGAASVAPMIVGGSRAEPGEYPWMVRLSTGCGGSLYSERLVLTAAHCVRDSGPDRSITVTHGVVDRDDPAAVVRTSTYAQRAPGYTTYTKGRDWALIRLDTPIAGAATLPIATTDAYASGVFDVMGWGATTPGGPSQRHLLKARVPFVDDDTCARAYPDLVRSDSVCAGHRDGGPDTCQGDSGGPMVRRDESGTWVQVGIVSWGDGCGAAGRYGVYSQVDRFASDIARAAADLSRPGAAMEFTATDDVPLPGGATSDLTVSGVTGPAPSVLRVGVDVVHPHRAWLRVDLVAPTGRVYRLKDESRDPGADLHTHHTVDASAEPADGRWTLHVQDLYEDGTGHLDGWRLIFPATGANPTPA